MKIFNTSDYFEKLKIRAVDVRNLKDINPIFKYKEIDINSIKGISDLTYGTIVTTVYRNRFDSNVWMYVNFQVVEKFIPEYAYTHHALIHPIKYESNMISYLTVDGYVRTFPKYEEYPMFDAVRVYETNIDPSVFKTADEFCDFFRKNNIAENFK